MELRKITLDNVWEIVRLKVTDEQSDFVSPNIVSIAEAYATEHSGCHAYPFGIYEDGIPVGFVMLGYDSIGEDDEPSVAKGNYCLWRFMISREHQKKGLGRKALETVLDFIGKFPYGEAEYCWLSYEPENAVAKSLYSSFGFYETGEVSGDELVAVKRL